MKLSLFTLITFIVALATLLVSGFSQVPAPLLEESLSPQTVIIAGTLVLASYRLDLCSAIHLGSCPLSFALSEKYTQPVTIQAQTSSTVIQPRTMEGTQVTLTPETPNLVVVFQFSVGSQSYNYSYPLPAVQSPGIFTVNIPLTQVIANLIVLGLPAWLLNQVTSLDFPVSLVSSVRGDMALIGFNSTQGSLIWTTPSTVQFNTTLTGSADDSSITIHDLVSVFSVGAQLILRVPLLPPITLVSFQQPLAEFGSSGSVPIGYWYHVAIFSDYSQVSGSGWYLSGTQVTFSVAERSVTVGGRTYGFAGWKGSGLGSYNGTQLSSMITVTGPFTETATWSLQPEQAPFLQLPPLAQAGLAVAAIVIIGGATFYFLRRRRGS